MNQPEIDSKFREIMIGLAAEHPLLLRINEEAIAANLSPERLKALGHNAIEVICKRYALSPSLDRFAVWEAFLNFNYPEVAND